MYELIGSWFVLTLIGISLLVTGFSKTSWWILYLTLPLIPLFASALDIISLMAGIGGMLASYIFILKIGGKFGKR